jgi:mannose-1-phosphate guanylyltransferase
MSSQNIKRCAIIMAGGSGERFWPLSRIKKPKQLLELSGSGRTMLEEAIDRVRGIIDIQDVFIITSSVLRQPIMEAIPELPAENVVAEPTKRNTAPCLALASSIIQAKYPVYSSNQISAAVLTADHIMTPVENFQNDIKDAFDLVENSNLIATIGIVPTRPETGYGYIEAAESINQKSNIFSVRRFVEKPNLERAQQYLEMGNYVWNSGMFFWRLDTFDTSLSKSLAVVGNEIPKMKLELAGINSENIEEKIHNISDLFANMPNISIDYGLMEKANNVAVVKSSFHWDDIGSFDSLDRVRSKDENNNIVSGKVEIIDMRNSIVINSQQQSKTIVTALGLEDIVIINTDDAIMICPKDRVQEVKKIVEQIRANGSEEYL